MSERASTYQAGIDATEGVKDILAAYATHHGHVELCLYAEMRKSGKKAAAFKNAIWWSSALPHVTSMP